MTGSRVFLGQEEKKEEKMIKQLIKIANELDKKGLRKEADYLDAVIKRATDEGSEEELRHTITGQPFPTESAGGEEVSEGTEEVPELEASEEADKTGREWEQSHIFGSPPESQEGSLLPETATLKDVIYAVNNIWKFTQNTREWITQGGTVE